VYWLAGLLASAAAWMLNSLLMRRGGDLVVIGVIPILEETIKTGIAMILGVSVPLAHSVFGLVEGLHDYVASKNLGLLAGVISLISHSFFGQLTVWVFLRSGSWLYSIAAAGLVHTLFNLSMVRLFKLRAVK